MSTAKRGTYRVEFIDGTVLITGNNYKAWWEHMTDFFYRSYRDKNGNDTDVIKSVEYSGVPFIDDGGLKWATPLSYQDVISEEGARLHQTFTPLEDIKFEPSYADKALLKKKYARL